MQLVENAELLLLTNGQKVCIHKNGVHTAHTEAGPSRLLISNKGNETLIIQAFNGTLPLMSNVPESNGSTKLLPNHVALFSQQESENTVQPFELGSLPLAIVLLLEKDGMSEQVAQYSIYPQAPLTSHAYDLDEYGS